MSRIKKYINGDWYEMVRSVVRCQTCQTIIESIHIHDYVVCKCGDISLDGGPFYGATITGKNDIIEDLCIWKKLFKRDTNGNIMTGE